MQLLNELPDWIDLDAWEGFVQMRKQIKKPLTERAKKLALRELDELRKQGQDPNAVLDQSTMHSWAGLFPLRSKAPQQTQPVETAAPWAEFRACIRDNRMPRDPVIAGLVKTFGGLSRLGEMTSWDIENRIRRDFDTSYRLAKAH